MRNTRATDSAVCELLLILFFLGSLLCVLDRSLMLTAWLHIPGTPALWIAALLALDASMAASLLSRVLLPLTTLAFGAASTVAGSAVLELREQWWRQLLLLVVAVPIHFLLSAWSITTASKLRQLLAGHGGRGRACGTALLLTLLAASASVLIVYLFQRGLI